MSWTLSLSRPTRFGATLEAICNVKFFLLRLNFTFPINLEIDQVCYMKSIFVCYFPVLLDRGGGGLRYRNTLYIANIKRVIKYGIFSRVFLSLFLLKYQRILMSWYFKRNKARNTSENVPYLITSLIFDLLIITTNALFCELLNISVKYWSRGGAIYLHWKRIFHYRSNQ